MTQSGQKDKGSSPQKLEEGRDYYIEDGKFVFTAYFLSSRGYCCNSGCRHCPYRDKKQPKA
ncbi:MAG: DUF5522 domain-containing protein [Saprospiraceae bacterium]|nr:DUF5522 domain-containing protein [Saprospiraceae bacterium]MDP4822165.1 DUF5522 domain-containing protein [Saprospiraceae bacterium]MDP4999095.1 DUF5522 domain-containing protein [Saprospiraceae bacterium]